MAGPADAKPMRVGLIILTDGRRPEELSQIKRQAEALNFDELILVANGTDVDHVDGWMTVRSAINRGVPGGRGLGLTSTECDVAVLLDDDSSLPSGATHLVDSVRDHFRDDPLLGALALRVVGTGTDQTLARWDPTARGRSCRAVCDVPTFPGNGHALRRSAVAEVGGYLEELFFKHEETELAWRLLDCGWKVRFDPSLVVEHPFTAESRHQKALELGLRNKLWIARLRLPHPLVTVAIVLAIARSLRHIGSAEGRRSIRSGIRTGLGPLPRHRGPISWKIVGHLTKLGRPPVL